MMSWLTAAFAIASAADHAPPTVTVDLDAAPRDRWTAALTSYNTSLHSTITFLESQPEFKTLFPIAKTIFAKDSSTAGWLPDELREEIDGIAAATRVDVGILVVLNSLYSLTASGTVSMKACTSIVAQPADGGPPVHGRNLDYSFHRVMRNITMTVNFVRSGVVRFTAVAYAGTVGFNTVIRHAGWSLSHDERDQGFIGLDWLDTFVRKRVLTFSRIRLLADQTATFAEAVSTMQTVPLAAPSYFVLAGARAGEGVVVTRDRDGGNGRTDTLRLDTAAGRWYLVETNYDYWTAPPHGDNRRAPAERALAALGAAKVTPKGLLSVLADKTCNSSAGERPVNNAMTVYSAVMSPGYPRANDLEVLMRDEKPPGCAPAAAPAAPMVEMA